MVLAFSLVHSSLPSALYQCLEELSLLKIMINKDINGAHSLACYYFFFAIKIYDIEGNERT